MHGKGFQIYTYEGYATTAPIRFVPTLFLLVSSYQLFRTVQLPATTSSIVAHKMVRRSWSAVVWSLDTFRTEVSKFQSFKHVQTKLQVVPGCSRLFQFWLSDSAAEFYVWANWGPVSSPAPRRPRNGQDHHGAPPLTAWKGWFWNALNGIMAII